MAPEVEQAQRLQPEQEGGPGPRRPNRPSKDRLSKVEFRRAQLLSQVTAALIAKQGEALALSSEFDAPLDQTLSLSNDRSNSGGACCGAGGEASCLRRAFTGFEQGKGREQVEP